MVSIEDNEKQIQSLQRYSSDEDQLYQLTSVGSQSVISGSPELLPKDYERWARAALTLMGGMTAIFNCRQIEHILEVAQNFSVSMYEMESGRLWKYDEIKGQLSPWTNWSHSEAPTSNGTLIGMLMERILLPNQPACWCVDAPEIDEEVKQLLQRIGVSTLVAIPIYVHDRPFGLLQLQDGRSGLDISEQYLALGALLVKHTEMAVERARLAEDVEKRLDILETLRQLSLKLTSHLDISKVLSEILESAVVLLGGEVRTTHIFFYENGKLGFAAAWDIMGKLTSPFSQPRPQGLTYTVARRGEAILVPDMRDHYLFKDTPKDWEGAIIGLPLKIGERVVGVMTISNRQPYAFTEDHLRILHLLADQAAIAIENARLHDLISKQAFTDPLTGIPNRRAFDKRLDEEVRRAKRYNRVFTLIMMDIDGFKKINDRYGHPQGDKALQLVANNIYMTLRDTDFLVRFGGDEFAVILPETNKEAAQFVAKKIVHNVGSSLIDLGDSLPISLSLSVGLSEYPRDGTTVEELYYTADKALYNVKNGNNAH
ncbi:MAG: sensor domain-containing diguanylate cyclase [Chloroflexota bacterium]